MKSYIPRFFEHITKYEIYCLILYRKLLTNFSVIILNSVAVTGYRSRSAPATDFSHQVYDQ